MSMGSQKSTPATEGAAKTAKAPARKRGRARVAALQKAGAEVFAETGYEAATMTGIAARAGASIGSAMLLTPFMLGAGLTKEAFVATMAVISLTTNMARITAFGGADLLTSDYVLLGLAVGVVMIPGNWIGRTFLRRMAPGTHSVLIDLFALIGGANFLWLAWAG